MPKTETKTEPASLHYKIPSIGKSYYASDFTHALLSSSAYMTHDSGDQLGFIDEPRATKYNKYLKNWKVQKVFSPPHSDDYYSALYVNSDDGHAVLAHRGTDIKGSIVGFNQSLKADMIEILNRNIGVQQIAAYAATKDTIEFLQKEKSENDVNYHFSMTGHSLGAWLAELSLYFCHVDFNYPATKAVTFDSPGTKDHLPNFASNIDNRNTSFNPHLLEVTTYLSAPNLVNICNRHIGHTYRIYPSIGNPLNDLKAFLAKPIDKLSYVSKFTDKLSQKLDPAAAISNIISQNEYYAYIFLSLTGHSLNPMLDIFDPQTGKPEKYEEAKDWPLLKYTSAQNSITESSLAQSAISLGVPEFLSAPACKLLSKLVPTTLTGSIAHICVDFISGNVNLLQICNSFKHLDLATNKLGYVAKPISSAEEEFDACYEGHYRLTEINPQQIIVPSSIKGTTEWYLKKLKHYHPEYSALDVPKEFLEYITQLKSHYKTGLANNAKAIISIHYNIDVLRDQIRFLQEINCPIIQDIANNSGMSLINNAVSDLSKRLDNTPSRDEVKKEIEELVGRQNVIFSNLPKPLNKFVGREEIFKHLDELFVNEKIVAISAFAGTGKSSTAAQYGHIFKNDDSTLVRWFPAETDEKLNSAYRQLAGELGIELDQCMKAKAIIQNRGENIFSKANTSTRAEENERILDMQMLVNLVNNKISKTATKILFIFDNVEQYSDIEKQIETLHNLPIKVLITTRDRNLLDEQGVNVHLEPFNRSEAINYIQQSLGGRAKTPQANQLADKLLSKEGLILPHKLGKAVALLKSNKLWSVAKYIEHIEQNKDQNEDDLLFNQITTTNPIAWQILQYGSLLDPDFIDIDIFKEILSKDDETLQQAIIDLEKLSLATLVDDQGQPGLKLHRLVQENLHEYCINDGAGARSMNKAELQGNLLLALSKLMPNVEHKPDEKWKTVEKLHPHIEHLLQSDISLNNSDELISIYTKMAEYEKIVTSNYDRSLSLHQQALKTCQNIYGDRHDKIVQIYTKIANIFRTKKDYDKALEYNKKSLSLIEDETLPIDDKTKADSFYELSCAYYFLKQSEIALEYDVKSLDMRQNLYQGDHPDIAQSLNAIGVTYDSLEQYNKALEYYLKSLEMRQNLYQGDHPDIAQSLNNIAFSYRDLKRYEQAIDYNQKSLEMRQRIYQGDHSEVVQSLDDIASVYEKLEEHDEALDYYKQALAMKQRLYKGDHKDILDSLSNIFFAKASSLADKKHYTDQHYNMAKRIYGKNHEELILPLKYMAAVYLDNENYVEASKYLRKALHVATELNMNKEIAPLLYMMGEGLRLCGAYESALDTHFKALKYQMLSYHEIEDKNDIADTLESISLICNKLKNNLLSSAYQLISSGIKCRTYKYDDPSEALTEMSNFFSNEIGYSYKALAYKKNDVLSKGNQFTIEGSSTYPIDIHEAKIICKLAKVLNKIAEKSEENKWSSGFFISKATRLGDWGVKGYTEDKYLKKELQDLYSDKNMQIAKMLCFEAICLGIAAKPVSGRKYDCLDEFIKSNPELLDKIFTSHPEYFVDKTILLYSARYMHDADSVKAFANMLNTTYNSIELQKETTNETLKEGFMEAIINYVPEDEIATNLLG